jgi:hypothetical protein
MLGAGAGAGAGGANGVVGQAGGTAVQLEVAADQPSVSAREAGNVSWNHSSQ